MGREKSAVFKKWENRKKKKNSAAYAAEPRLINESGFKSRAAYDGARTVD